jgi:hypothetical protein
MLWQYKLLYFFLSYTKGALQKQHPILYKQMTEITILEAGKVYKFDVIFTT